MRIPPQIQNRGRLKLAGSIFNIGRLKWRKNIP